MADAIEERRARDERHGFCSSEARRPDVTIPPSGKPGRLCYTCADLSVRQLFAEPGRDFAEFLRTCMSTRR